MGAASEIDDAGTKTAGIRTQTAAGTEGVCWPRLPQPLELPQLPRILNITAVVPGAKIIVDTLFDVQNSIGWMPQPLYYYYN
jgi:hypothetical protein